MKNYNLKEFSTEKEFSWGRMNVLILGESGRGRLQRYVPISASASAESELLEIGATKNGNPRLVSSDSNVGWLAVVSGRGWYERGGHGTVYVPRPDRKKVRIVEAGKGAFGDAGRVGNWFEFLLEVEEDTFLKVRPSCLKQQDPYWLYFSDLRTYLVPKPEMSLFCEEGGLMQPPEEFADLYDLSEDDDVE